MSVRQRGDTDTFQIDIYPPGKKGKRIRLTYKGTREEAELLELEMLRRQSGKKPKLPFIKQAIPDWLEFCENNLSKSTVVDIKKCLKNLRPFFGATRFISLVPSMIEAYKTKRFADGVIARTINKELSYFSSLLKSAKKNEYCDQLPFAVELIPETDSPDPVILSLEEVQALIDNIEPKYLCPLLLYIDQGLRRRETLDLTVERVDLANNSFKVLGKNKKEATLPITTDRLRLALLIAVDAAGSGPLFVNPSTGKTYYSIRKALQRAAKAAGIKKRVYAHLLRHCFGTHGIAAGINTRVMQTLLRHSTVQVTEKYTQLAADFKESETRKYKSIVERERGPMQKVIGNKRYDTKNAEKVTERTNKLSAADPDYCKEEIYRTSRGNWFLLGEGGSRTKYAPDGYGVGRDIIPLSGHEAQAWLERHSTVEIVEEYFTESIEDA